MSMNRAGRPLDRAVTHERGKGAHPDVPGVVRSFQRRNSLSRPGGKGLQ